MALYNYQGAAPRIALIPTRGKEAVMNFPVLPGAPVYFLDETAPYIYVKTAGYPPFGGVTVETIRLIKEEEPQQTSEEPKQAAPTSTDEQIAGLWAAIEEIKKGMNGGEVNESAVEE
ncbi:MAG: hypothetical protein IJM71_02410 [Clostridia bacterium]|nr:hypothetical protein [Clostridia bacterium]